MFSFQYNKQKTIQALRYHFISRKEIKVMMVLVNIFALLSAGLFFLKKISPVAFLLSSFLWMMMMVMFWFLLPRIVYGRSPSFKRKFNISYNEAALTLEMDTTSRSFEWKEFQNWIESPHFFHLYFNSRSFFLIPKEAFGEEESAFRNFCSKKINA